MDTLLYDWHEPGKQVWWIRSSVEEPFVWTMFRGVVADAYDINDRFYYHTVLHEVIAQPDWIVKHVANKTFRLIDIDTGKPHEHYCYFDTKQQNFDFMQDWKHYYASNWLWDLTADITFVSFEEALQGIKQLYKLNCNVFKSIVDTYAEQLRIFETR